MIDVTVMIQDKKIPSKFIEMSMEEYRNFIEEQSKLLNITETTSNKESQGVDLANEKGFHNIVIKPISIETKKHFAEVLEDIENQIRRNKKC